MGSGMEQRIALGYGLFICLVVLVSAYLWYIYALVQRNVPTNVRFDPGEAASSDAEAGIDQATLECYPKMAYSQAKLEKRTTATCCSICLGDYRDADVLQMLPQCGHHFHVDCINRWLRSHASCPNCRSLPAPGSRSYFHLNKKKNLYYEQVSAPTVTGPGGFCCIYINSTTNPPSERMTGTGDAFGLEAVAAPTNVEVGIDQATLMRYPRVTYSQANLEDKGTTAGCCCICLYDFEDTDVLRLLPQCGHPFHLDCVDPWLRSHSSCPICRSFAAPRAEVVSSTQPTRSQ
ncbi:unnamed protein product [Musa acuminata subsp. burmannicoides]